MRTAESISWKESEKTRKGVKYKVANGGLIPNKGEKVIEAEDVNGNNLVSRWQGADITKALAWLKQETE